MRITSIRALLHLACDLFSLRFSDGHRGLLQCCKANIIRHLNDAHLLCQPFKNRWLQSENVVVKWMSSTKNWRHRRLFVYILTENFSSSYTSFWIFLVAELYASFNISSVRNLFINASTNCAQFHCKISPKGSSYGSSVTEFNCSSWTSSGFHYR